MKKIYTGVFGLLLVFNVFSQEVPDKSPVNKF